MSEIITAGPLKFSEPNCPTRVGEIVENIEDIYSIPTPRLGMQVFVKSEKKSFVITSLKSKVIGGVDVPEVAVEAFEAVGAKSITWNNDTDPSNMNDFIVAGVYNIKGERTRTSDNLPILNTGGGHTFNARLTVLDSSISGTGEDDDKCITQVLSFSNRLGQGEVYIRTGKGSSLDNLSWEKWSTLQRNVNVDEVRTLDNLIDNGIYSGVYVGTGNKFTFVMVVINDYALAEKLGADRVVNQFLYAVEAGGHIRYTTRKKIGYAPWSEWGILNKSEIDYMIKSSVDNAIKGVISDAPEAFDTLKEIADWIANDKTGATAMATKINENTDAIRLNYADINRLDTNKAERSDAMQYDTLGVSTYADKAEIYGRSITGKPRTCDFPAATTEKAGVMSAKDKVVLDSTPGEINKIKNGDTIVGQAREIHSRNGKTITDSFLARTTAGSGTIGDGVASLKSVGGNIVKNLVDGTFESGWNGRYTVENGIAHVQPYAIFDGIGYIRTSISEHKYYVSAYVFQKDNKSIIMRYGTDTYYERNIGGWQFQSHISTNKTHKGISFLCTNEVVDFFIANPICIDLTETYKAGNEPTKEECDRLFGTIDALPQGLSIANPTAFISTGFNQFNPDNVLDGKAIVDNAIVSGDKKIAVIPCLPCKVGVGENNGYCIHGDFGEDIKVYLTPLNPMEVDGELYMHELTKDATTDTYVPQIKGYMLVEVPTTANLCAHFLWSEDKCERDSYEPYFESKVELPVIPQMSEWGLAGIQSSGTLACDTIDFERGVYVKRIGSVDLGSLDWYSQPLAFVSTGLKTLIKPPTLGNVGNAITYKLTITSAIPSSTTPLKSNEYKIYNDGAIYINNKDYADVTTLKSSLQGVMLYYELATPKEYPLPKVDNNYISSDYGVEQFDGVVPLNANNLYYMRSLAGETRNFLDRLYDNTDKTDAKEVADYITNGIESNKPNLALRSLFIAAGAEYNDTNNHIVKDTPWKNLVDSVDYKAQWNLDVVTGSVQTLTYGSKSYEYVDDNGTWKIIARVGDKLIWDYTKVIHRKGYYYINGIGDITEEQMLKIYNRGYINENEKCPLGVSSGGVNNIRTNICRTGLWNGSLLTYLCYSNRVIETINLHFSVSAILDTCNVFFVDTESIFSGAMRLQVIDTRCLLTATNWKTSAFSNCEQLREVRIRQLQSAISLASSSLLSKASLLYMINNSTAKSAITITLHPDAYARLENDADIVAALAAQPLVTLVSA